MRFPNSTRASAAFWISLIAGFGVIAICATAALGWLTQSVVLVQVRVGWPVMQVSAALSLFCLGASLVSLVLGRPHRAAILAGPAFALATATLLEDAFGLPLGLHHLLRALPGRADAFVPGPMALGTAVALLFGAIGVWLLSSRVQRPTLNALSGGIPLVIGSVSLLERFLATDHLYASQPLLQLAIHTAASCALLGAGVLAHNWRVSQVQERGLPRWIPLSACAVFSLVTIMLWTAARDREELVLREEAAVAVGSLSDAIQQELTTRIESYERMAARLSFTGGPTDDWQRDAELHLKHSHDPYATLLLLDAALVPTAAAPRQSVGLPSRDAVLGVASIHEAIQDAQVTRTAAISRRFEIAPGVPGFAIATAVYSGDTVSRILVAELAYEPILARMLDRSPYSIRVLSQGVLLYAHGERADTVQTTPLTLNVASDTWQLQVGPSNAGKRWQASRLSTGVLLFGFVLSIAVGMAAHLVRRIQRQSSTIEDANTQLSFEVDQRRHTEEQLRLTSTLQRAILDSTSHAVISTDRDGIIQTFNRAAEQMLGYAAADLVGQTTPALLHDRTEVLKRAQILSLELESPVANGFEALVARARLGEVDRREWTYVRKNAGRFPVELSVSGMVDDQAALTGFVVTAVDITERRHSELLRHWAEDSLRRTEELLHSVLDATLSGVLAMRAIRSEDNAISDFECLLANPAAERLLGAPSGSLVGGMLSSLALKDDGAGLFQQYISVVETGEPLDIEHHSPSFGRWFRIVATPRGSDGMALTVEDITRRKEMDAELERYLADVESSRDQIHEQSVMLQWQADAVTKARDEALAGSRELERALKMQADFVSFASHQLRTPLAGIKWLLELAMDEPDQTEELKSYVVDSLASAERLIGLVNDLLDISRLEGGRMVPELKRVDLALCCRDVASNLHPNITIARHSLVMAGVDEPRFVSADPQLIRQIIVNLLSNAVKYTPPGGHISLEVSWTDDEVQLAVGDSGLGVPIEARPRLFEKFFRAENVTTMETEGTGLGLYMVHLILQKFGGRIWYEPREDAPGSRFVFVLPIVKETESINVNAETDPHRGGRPSTTSSV